MKTLRFIRDFLLGFAICAVVAGKAIGDLEEKASKSGAAYWKTDDRGNSKLIWKHEETEVEKK